MMMYNPLTSRGSGFSPMIRGDGYTQAERKKFYDDVERMTDDLFKGETFKSILPVVHFSSLVS